MILAPEIALLAAAIALLLTLTNSLMVFSARRAMNQQVKELRLELDANLSANHQLARHVRALQRGHGKAQSGEGTHGKYDARFDDRYSDRYSDKYEEESEHSDEDGRFESAARDRIREANPLTSREQDTQSLADKLGLSQSEAEIVSHLKPRRSMSQMIRESA